MIHSPMHGDPFRSHPQSCLNCKQALHIRGTTRHKAGLKVSASSIRTQAQSLPERRPHQIYGACPLIMGVVTLQAHHAAQSCASAPRMRLQRRRRITPMAAHRAAVSGCQRGNIADAAGTLDLRIAGDQAGDRQVPCRMSRTWCESRRC